MGTWARLALAPAVLASACGGSVNLDSPATGGSGGDDSSSGKTSHAGAQQGGGGGAGTGSTEPNEGGKTSGGAASTENNTGGTMAGGAPSASGGNATAGAKDPGSAGRGGATETPNDPSIAWLAFDAQPAGESRGIYWTSAANGCPERLSADGVEAKQPAFSSDGKFIAYAANEGGEYQIYLLEIASGGVTQLTDLPQGASYPTFSPSGLSVAFVTGDPEALRDGQQGDTPDMGDILLVNLKTLETQLIAAREDEYPYFAPAFSGSDRLIVSNSYVIRALYLDLTSESIQVANQRVLSPPGVPQEPAPSPDGQKLVYPDTCTDTLQLNLLRIDLGSPRSCAPPSRDFRRDLGVQAPDWGSFGFVATETIPPSHGILLFREEDLSSGGVVAAARSARNPSWAPADFTRACR